MQYLLFFVVTVLLFCLVLLIIYYLVSILGLWLFTLSFLLFLIAPCIICRYLSFILYHLLLSHHLRKHHARSNHLDKNPDIIICRWGSCETFAFKITKLTNMYRNTGAPIRYDVFFCIFLQAWPAWHFFNNGYSERVEFLQLVTLRCVASNPHLPPSTLRTGVFIPTCASWIASWHFHIPTIWGNGKNPGPNETSPLFFGSPNHRMQQTWWKTPGQLLDRSCLRALNFDDPFTMLGS